MNIGKAIVGWFAAVAIAVVVLAGDCFAQAKKAAEEAAGPGYTLSYFAVVFFVGLGLLIVLRSASRSTEVKMKRED